MTKNKKLRLSTAQLILLGFLGVILVGSAVLMLPVSVKSGVKVGYLDALFTSVTATCVTGLVTVETAATWSVFGQAVILVLVQVGGLGVITVMSWLMMLMHRRIGISSRLLIQDAFNLNTMSGLIRFVKNVTAGTLLVELVGALSYMTRFVPEFGARGVWISVFNSVSAFCNAGIDIIGSDSLAPYAGDFVVNLTTCILVVMGGIGYIVWWDVLHAVRRRARSRARIWPGLSLHTKIALSVTLGLIVFGAAGFFVLEYNNPLTLGPMSLPQKIGAAVFQSVTTRTAGFCTVAQQNLTNASAILSLLLMFIGGSPVGTAGGIKTVTAAVMFVTAISVVRGKSDVELFHRRLSESSIRKATAVMCCSFLTAFASTVLLAAMTDASAIDIIYETISATATVGLTRNLTAQLTDVGKIIICFTMYFGRVGPISLAVALSGNGKSDNAIINPTEEISVG